MPAYKYKNTAGKTLWYANFYYTDWLGNRVRKCKRGFATQREAKEYEKQFLASTATDPTITFGGLIENYMKDCETRLKPTTLDNKKWIIDTKILPFFKDVPINEIDQLMIRRWQNQLIEYRDENGKPYEESYLRTLHASLSAIFNYAVRYYSLKSNPCRTAGVIGKKNKKEMKFWTLEQYQKFRELIPELHYQVAFDLLFYCGVREGELLALSPADFHDGVVTISKNYQVVQKRELIQTPKTEKGMRDVTIPESMTDEIDRYIKGMVIDQDDRIFYFTAHALRAVLRRKADKAGLPRIRLHDLRHSHVALLIEMQVPIEEIARRVGHESAETTWRMYAHLYPGKDIALAQKLDNVRVTGKTSDDTENPSTE